MILTSLRALLLLLAFMLPFEVVEPVLVLPWLKFTNLEIVACACILLWLGHTIKRARGALPTPDAFAGMQGPVVWAAVLLLALSLLSSVLAPANWIDAVKATMRLGAGIAVFWMLIDTVRERRLVVALLWALVAGAGVSAVLGLGEALAWPPVVSTLSRFKGAPTLVGGMLRVSGTFQYATMTAMYLEAAVVLAVALAATARTPARRGAAMVCAAAATAVVALTLSRAGMVTLALVLAAGLAAGRKCPELRRLVGPAAVTLIVLVGTIGALAWTTDTVRTRLVTENDLSWYGATYSVPPSLELTSGEVAQVTVEVRNTGSIRWHQDEPNAFVLSYYWLGEDGPLEGHVEVPLPREVAPGDSVRIPVRLRADLPSGDYRVAWGMLQQRVLWFRHREVPEAYTAVRVEAGEAPAVAPPPSSTGVEPGGAVPSRPATIPRIDLWRTALRMWSERPLLGMGPGTFRYRYGEYLGLEDFDDSIHTNNLYLEFLVGWGLLGALAFAGLMLVVGLRWLDAWRTTSGDDAVLNLALGGALLAFFIHGTLDYFLGFTPHYLLFWMLAGLIVAISRYSETGRSTATSRA